MGSSVDPGIGYGSSGWVANRTPHVPLGARLPSPPYRSGLLRPSAVSSTDDCVHSVHAMRVPVVLLRTGRTRGLEESNLYGDGFGDRAGRLSEPTWQTSRVTAVSGHLLPTRLPDVSTRCPSGSDPD
jgi:hypothetical protein